jgi:hypothetical protein
MYFENLIVEQPQNKTYKLKINIDALKLNYLKKVSALSRNYQH